MRRSEICVNRRIAGLTQSSNKPSPNQVLLSHPTLGPNMNKTRSRPIAFIIILGIGVLAGYAGLRSGEVEAYGAAAGQTVTVTGVVVCLPHKDTSGPQTLECAFGVKDKTGSYYGLRDESHRFMASIQTGKTITVTGVLRSDPKTIYDIKEIIEIQSLTEGKSQKDPAVNSFDECAAAGYPIMESYPERCRTPDGRTFVRRITPNKKSGAGGIFGTVLLGPMCPVIENPPDPKCADKPYQTLLVVTTPDDSRVIKKFRSNGNGMFRVNLAPGQYVIRSEAAAGSLPYCSTSETIQVAANRYTEVVIHCDSGIR
jgi:hypothetical protein